MNGRTNGRTDRQTDGQTNGRTDKQTDGQGDCNIAPLYEWGYNFNWISETYDNVQNPIKTSKWMNLNVPYIQGHSSPSTLSSCMFRVSEWVLFNTNSAIFQLYHGKNKLIFNEMLMRSPLYYTNTLSWSCIVQPHWKISPRIDMSPHSDTLQCSLGLSPSVLSPTSKILICPDFPH